MIPAVSKQLLAFSQENYKDFMLVPAAGMERPAWFVFFMWMEVVFHVPVSFWSLRGLWNGKCVSFSVFRGPPSE